MTDTNKYYAVIFTATFADNIEGYADKAKQLAMLASEQPGYLGIDHYFQDNREITVSYWRDLDAIKAWKENPVHREAQEKGRSLWYKNYKIEIACVERAYEHSNH